MRRVVVTGMGAVTPLGNNVESFFSGLVEGRSAVGIVSRFDPSGFPSRIAAEVKEFDPSLYLDKKELRRTDLYTQYAIAAADMAKNEAGLDGSAYPPERIGIIWGSGIGGIATFEEQTKIFLTKGVDRVSPFFITMMISNMAAGVLAIRYGYKGDNFAVVTACASGAHAIGLGVQAIRDGRIDAAITGGSEAPIVGISFAGFCANRALSTRNDEPEKASRPFDTGRDGFVMAEGAGAVVLEELEHARRRGARIYAEVLGVGMSSDAFHITAPPENGEGAYSSMLRAVKDANLSPDEIDYINAHGTSTPVGDIAELRAIKRLFGTRNIKVSSNKSMIGHLLGAAGAVESIATIKTIETGIIPPTINIENPEPEAEGIDLVPDKAIRYPVRYAISNSFGFGGHNISILFGAFNG